LLKITVGSNFIFKLDEEENPALLLHLPKLFAETPIFGSAPGSNCRLVVGIAQGSFSSWLHLNCSAVKTSNETIMAPTPFNYLLPTSSAVCSVFASASGLSCWLVEANSTSRTDKTALF
jgi:hypothetical protein